MKKKNSDYFKQFASRKSNASLNAGFKQQKRSAEKESKEYFEKKKADKKMYHTANVFAQTSHNVQKVVSASEKPPTVSDTMPLNKYIAHAGVASRRDAAEMVKKGLVKVNGKQVIEPGYKVSLKDEIKVNGKKIVLTEKFVYMLLNKPKDYITTTDDPQKRKTVMDIIGRSVKERIYPVGRLDRNTTGVLLLTNDGELAQQLTHPRNEVKKVYHVTLNKPLEKRHFDQIVKGIELEDGPATVDALAYTDAKDKTQIGIEIHCGRNRIIRRIFAHLGYEVKSLDRVMFAGLTKKNVERGKWRFLTEKEIKNLKYFKKWK